MTLKSSSRSALRWLAAVGVVAIFPVIAGVPAGATALAPTVLSADDLTPYALTQDEVAALGQVQSPTPIELATLAARHPFSGFIGSSYNERFVVATAAQLLVVDVSAAAGHSTLSFLQLDRGANGTQYAATAASDVLPDGSAFGSAQTSTGAHPWSSSPNAPADACGACTLTINNLGIFQSVACSGGPIVCGLGGVLIGVIGGAACDSSPNCVSSGPHSASVSLYFGSGCGLNYCNIPVSTVDRGKAVTRFGVDSQWEYPPPTYANGDSCCITGSHHSTVPNASSSNLYFDYPYSGWNVYDPSDWFVWTKCSTHVQVAVTVWWSDGSAFSTGYSQYQNKQFQTGAANCPGWGP